MTEERAHRSRGRDRGRGRAGGGLAAGLLALALLATLGGTARAVASRTSDGLGVASPGPQPSAAQTTGEITATRFGSGSDDWLVGVLGVIAAGGFGSGLWLLRPRVRRSSNADVRSVGV